MTQQAPTVSDIMEKTGLSLADTNAALRAFAALFDAANLSPKDELLQRLNTRVQDRVPGKSYNWKGL